MDRAELEKAFAQMKDELDESHMELADMHRQFHEMEIRLQLYDRMQFEREEQLQPLILNLQRARRRVMPKRYDGKSDFIAYSRSL